MVSSVVDVFCTTATPLEHSASSVCLWNATSFQKHIPTHFWKILLSWFISLSEAASSSMRAAWLHLNSPDGWGGGGEGGLVFNSLKPTDILSTLEEALSSKCISLERLMRRSSGGGGNPPQSQVLKPSLSSTT